MNETTKQPQQQQQQQQHGIHHGNDRLAEVAINIPVSFIEREREILGGWAVFLFCFVFSSFFYFGGFFFFLTAGDEWTPSSNELCKSSTTTTTTTTTKSFHSWNTIKREKLGKKTR